MVLVIRPNVPFNVPLDVYTLLFAGPAKLTRLNILNMSARSSSPIPSRFIVNSFFKLTSVVHRVGDLRNPVTTFPK